MGSADALSAVRACGHSHPDRPHRGDHRGGGAERDL